MNVCDFSRSYLYFCVDLQKQQAITITNKQPFTKNQVRIPLESRCVLTDPKGKQTQYVLGASCKTELVNVKTGMWTQPNADFAPIASEDDFLIIKRWQRHDLEIQQKDSSMAKHRERQVGKAREAWHEHRLDVTLVDEKPLTVDEVIAATLNNRQMTARTELELVGGWHALIEYPVKTINVSDRDRYYQVDTGPVLLPRIAGASSPISGFELAYVAHNAPDWVEFVVNVPTAVGEGITVPHYSESRGMKAKNGMFLLG